MVSPLSVSFAIFVIGGYFATYWFPLKHRSTLLSFLSVAFYAWIDTRSALLLLCLTFVVKQVADRQGCSLKRRNVGLLVTTGVLTLWRLTPETARFFNADLDAWWIPLSSAFLALQAMIIIMDVYRKDTDALGYRETLLVLGFFPKVLAGPLVRTGSFLYNLRKKPADVNLKEVGALIASASIKKYALSVPLESLASLVVPSSMGLSKIDLIVMFLVGPVRFVIDISAYTDLARAGGKMCGIELPENMRNPFGARTISDFLRRWHVTVSGFFRDYVLAEITTPKTKGWLYCLATVFTCSLIGVWHTPGVSMILWGVLVGLPVGIEQLRVRRGGERRRGVRFGAVRTISYYGLLSPLYTNDTITHNLRMIGNLFSLEGFSKPETPYWGFVVLGVGILWFSGAMAWTRPWVDRIVSKTSVWVFLPATAVVVSFFAGFSGPGIANFIYQGL